MDIEVLEQRNNVLKILVKDIPLHVINSIRRTIIAEVPTMAIDYVVFIVNSSVFYDEYLAHRLGLIPLTSKEALHKYKSPEECAEAGEKGIFSEDCFVKLELEGSGEPGKIITLYSGDLKTSDPDVIPVYDKIPIVALTGKKIHVNDKEITANQEIKLEAYARLGRGKEHAKWSPVSVATHKYVPMINIDYSRCKSIDCKKCIDVCPRNIFYEKDNRIVVNKDKVYDCMLCRRCEEVCPEHAIKVGWIPNHYILYIESTGALPLKTILNEATKILMEKIDNLIKTLREV